MSDRKLLVLVNGQQKQLSSSTSEIDFSSVRIGASNLPITEDAGALSFGEKAFKAVASINGTSLSRIVSAPQISGSFEFQHLTAGVGVFSLQSNSLPSQSFKEDMSSITGVNLYMKKVGSPVCDLSLAIRATDIDGKPTGANLYTSNEVYASSGLTGSFAEQGGWTFTGATLTPFTKYCFVIIVSNITTLSGSDYIDFQINTGNPYAGGEFWDPSTNLGDANMRLTGVRPTASGALVKTNGSGRIDPTFIPEIATAQGDATTALANAATAQGDATTALANAATATSNAATAQGEVDALETSLGAVVNSSGVYVAHSGTNYINGNSSLTADLIDLDAQIKANADAIALITGSGLNFSGSLDASALGSQLDDAPTGSFYVVTVAGTIFGTNPISLGVGDNLIAKVDITGTPTNGNDWIKIDNTEAPDILRNTMLASAQIFVGNGSGVATAVGVSGELSLSNAGVATLGNAAVIGKVLTGYTPGAGTVSASDTILSALQKIDANVSAEVSAVSKVNDNGSAITVGQVVYIKPDGDVDLARANAGSTSTPALGIVKDATIASAGSGLITVGNGARVSGFSGRTPGATQYLSAGTAGALTETAPSSTGQFIVVVGRALSATEIVFNPEAAIEIL